MSSVEQAASSAAAPMRRRRRVLYELARIFSTAFNPFLTALGLFVVLAHTLAPDDASFWRLLLASTAFSSIGPMLYVLRLYATGRVTDLDMSIRAEREAVFSVFVFFYFAGTAALWAMHAPVLIVATMAGYTASCVVVGIITRYWKISMHALGVTAPLVIFFYLYGDRPLPFVVLVPLVGWSRVFLRAHTPLQVIAGSALGFTTVTLFFRLFRLV